MIPTKEEAIETRSYLIELAKGLEMERAAVLSLVAFIERKYGIENKRAAISDRDSFAGIRTPVSNSV